MKDLLKFFGAEIEVAENKLVYDKADYRSADDWEKTLEAGSYAYKNLESDLKTLYFGARYMEKTVDEDLIKTHDLMIDATVINPGKVGEEYVKTVGHYHGIIPGLIISYPEVYEPVSGRFEYLLQSTPDSAGKVDVIWVLAEPGEKVIMPPNWGHVSMNVGNEPALEIDVQKRDNPDASDYSLFKENRGGAFYRTGAGLEANDNYQVNSIRIVRPKEKPEWGIVKNKSLYQSVIESPDKFGFLVHPQNYNFDINTLFVEVDENTHSEYLK